jgi:hypothetical protein
MRLNYWRACQSIFGAQPGQGDDHDMYPEQDNSGTQPFETCQRVLRFLRRRGMPASKSIGKTLISVLVLHVENQVGVIGSLMPHASWQLAFQMLDPGADAVVSRAVHAVWALGQRPQRRSLPTKLKA